MERQNIGLYLNLAILLSSFFGAPFIMDGLKSEGGDWSAPGYKFIFLMIGGTAFAVAVVLGLSNTSKNADNSIRPSIFRTPLDMSKPIQTFFIGSLSFISMGIGGFTYALLFTPFRWEWVLLICIGVGSFLGVLINQPKLQE
jgi:hypothetical protein